MDNPDPSAGISDAPASVGATAFAILAREHHRGLLVYARALSRDEQTSGDLVQDAFLAAWKNLASFDVTRDFGAWMRGIVRNKWREYCRKAGREIGVDEQVLERWEAEFTLLDHAREEGRGEFFDWLEDCLQRLPASLLDVIRRFYYRRESGEESARALGIDPALVRKRLQRARESLRQCLEKKSVPPFPHLS